MQTFLQKCWGMSLLLLLLKNCPYAKYEYDNFFDTIHRIVFFKHEQIWPSSKLKNIQHSLVPEALFIEHW